MLSFDNTQYSLAPAAQLNNIRLSLTDHSGVPLPGTEVTLSLPTGFTYGDGGTGVRNFTTDEHGKVVVNEVKGVTTPGPYSLVARSSEQTAIASVTVNKHASLGEILDKNMVQNDIAVLSPDGTQLWVAQFNNGVLLVIDTARNEVKKVLEVTNFRNPNPIVFNPLTNHTYLGVQEGVWIFDTTTLERIGEIDPGYSVSKLALSPDCTHLYAMPYDELVVRDEVLVIDTATQDIETRIPITRHWPIDCVISPNSPFLYVSQAPSRELLVVNTDTHSLETSIDIGRSIMRLAISPNGKFVYAARGDFRNVFVIDTSTHQKVKEIESAGVHNMTFGPDGRYLYATCSFEDKVLAIDTQTNEIVGEMLFAGALGVAITADNTRAYITSSNMKRGVLFRELPTW
ncbi:hypothetical protein ACIOYV_03160 [Pseudomonas sp. NPDC087342]|uniref:hypothetical protein n=1 Tax=Pseudomonas sp. NPDC087342 TaxID=3364437 RepID=UPI003814FD77